VHQKVTAAVDAFSPLMANRRLDQSSHRFLEDKLAEERTLAVVAPAIFFGIAAFLLNMVLGRLIEVQRE
jgi:putative ABC transport system permease protein